VKQTYRLMLMAAILALLLGMTESCGSHQHKAPATGALPVEPKAYTLQDAVSELDKLEKPDGVDAKLWDELKWAFEDALKTQSTMGRRGSLAPLRKDSSEPGWSARPTLKIISSPPSGPANKVSDLTATRETNGDFTLSWRYKNLGDYDQDGTVGISDITPLAVHFSQTYDTETEADSIQAVIDGSGNGKIGIEDITPLAASFSASVAQYSVQGGDQQQGPFTEVSTAQLPADGRGDARLAFSLSLGAQPAYTYWRIVPVDGEGSTSETSNVVVLNVEAPVRVLGVSPLNGAANSEVSFTLFYTGTGPFTFEWNFGGGAAPNTSTAAQPTATLSPTDGEYAAQVKVTGATSSVTYHFTLTVTPTPGNPPVINSVGPFSGMSGDELNFSADVSGDDPLTYSWEFDGGASPPVSSEVSPAVILSRGGTLPAPDVDYPCRLTVTNDFGTAVQDFTLTVSAQWHVDELPLLPGKDSSLLSVPGLTAEGNLAGVYQYDELPGEPGGIVVCLAYLAGDTWQTEVIGSVIRANSPSLQFDSRGRPCFSYSLPRSEGMGAREDLRFARKEAGGWVDQFVASCGVFPVTSQLMLDSQDRAVISFSYISVDGESGRKIARETAGGWEIFDRPDGPVSSLQDGRVVVASDEADASRALLYRETESGWESKLIMEATEGDVAYPSCLVIDSVGKAHVTVGGSLLGLNVVREQANGSFSLDSIGKPVEGIQWNLSLLLTPWDEELVLFIPQYNEVYQLMVIAWRESGGWQYIECPIGSYRGFPPFFVHPDGYPVLVSSDQTACYW
jgi:hypothetical protein